jgi:hypothetical protein
MIGEWVALPVLRAAGATGLAVQVMYPTAERLLQHCDGVLRLPGDSVGADRDVEIARERGLPVRSRVEDVPGFVPDTAATPALRSAGHPDGPRRLDRVGEFPLARGEIPPSGRRQTGATGTFVPCRRADGPPPDRRGARHTRPGQRHRAHPTEEVPMDITSDQQTATIEDRDEPVIILVGNPRRIRL